MKLSKQQEKEMMRLYNSYWENYLEGDVKSMASLLAKEYTQVGSAEGEVFFNKKDAVKFLRDTIDQVAGKLEMRNRVIKPEQQDGFMLIHEQCDLYALAGKKWIFYSKFRASTLMQKKKDRWKFIHQHSSFPDTKTEEGQNVAIDKIAEENLQLRAAVKRRTTELEQKNRELEIETALEKVRAVAMSMNHAGDMLDICKTIALQLQSLGVNKIRNVQTAIFYEEKGTYMNYEYYAKHDKTIITETSYTNHKIHKDFAAQMLKGKDEFFSTHIKGKKKVADWIAYQKTTNVFIDTFLETAKSLSYYWYSLGPVALGISTYKPLNDGETNLFKRFLKVFELSYRRYLDIEKAEIQAKEAKIETALEKVRSRSLAMHNSDELEQVAASLFMQLAELGLTFDGVLIFIFEKEKRNVRLWIATNHLSAPVKIDLPYDEEIKNNAIIKDLWNAIETGEHIFNISYSGETKNDYFRYVAKYNESKIPESVRNIQIESDSWTAYFAAEKNSMIGFDSWSEHIITNEDFQILIRFAKVFEQAYTRFLDLQKAEAQAREAQIEAALEKVRSRSLAMHNSNELSEVVAAVFEKLKDLDFLMDDAAAIIITYIEGSKDHIQWIADPGQSYAKFFKTPYTDHSIPSDLLNAKESGVDFFSKIYPFEEKNTYFHYLFNHSDYKYLPDAVKEMLLESKDYGFSAAFEKKSAILIPTNSGKLVSGSEKDILKRFVKVFEQAYTRFLDLQKAEAQAREAQIEAALERVRSRTMGMQKSEDLKEIIQVVYEQFVHLNILVEHAGFIMDYKSRDDMNIWLADQHEVPFQVTIPYFDSAHWNSFNEAKEKGMNFFANNLSFEEKNRFYQDLFKLFPVPDEAKEYYFSCPGLAVSTVLLENVGLYIENFSGIPYTDDENRTLMRFGKVFQQTYTRFLDLQKAEAQAREAKIEAAMERTRTQSMIMQHSEELDDTLRVFHEQVLLLGIQSAFSFLWLPDEEKDRHIFWAAWAENNSTVFKSKAINYPLDRNEPATAQCLVDWKGNEPVVSYHVPPAGVESYFAAWQELIDGVEQLKPEYFQGGLYYVEAFLKYGCFGVMVKSELQEDEKKILARFAIEFERTYTRFLDLQKAEAQVREAQIEAGLERVRSRAMAMQNSEELNALVGTVFTELTKLDLILTRSVIMIYEPDTLAVRWWMASSEAPSQPMNFLVKYHDLPFFNGYLNGWKKRTMKWLYELEGKAKIELDDFLFTETELSQLPDFVIAGMRAPDKVYLNASFNNFGNLTLASLQPLSNEHFDILLRFAKVFDLTYTRFNDLKQAEAQAREAQIELSLERVRAKTMAMHNSQDVGDTVATLFDEVVKLGIETIRCGIGIMHEPGEMEIWTAKPDENGKVDLIIGRMDMMMHPLLQGAFNGWKNKQEFYTYELAGSDLINYFNAINNHPDYPIKYDIASLPSKIIHSEFHFPEGTLFVFSLETLSAESSKIFKRFAGVFGQTYRRYLDLKKAEVQARHAQIEAAMEKVRARSLAMQKPEELIEVAEVLRKEMGSLGVEELETSSIYIVDETTRTTECWYAIKDVREEDKKLVSDHMTINLQDTWVGREMQKFYTSGQKQISILMQGENRKEWINYCAQHSKVLQGYYGNTIPERTYHLLKFSNGYMGAASPGNISAESWDLLQRATAVFSFAYTRFQDLQNAAAREREAQIELALERVRARTMAMFKSDELAETAVVLFKQMIGLGIAPNRLYIAIINDNSGDLEFWITDENGDKVSSRYIVNVNKNISIKKMYEGWAAKKKTITIDMQGKELEGWLTYWKEEFHVPFKPGAALKRRVQNIAYFSKGFIAIASPDDQPETTINLLERFAAVFNLTYTRFSDLQQAEAQAREATIEAALEKVRGRAMAMHSSNDLSATASMVFIELRKLGISPIRCGVGLLKKESRKAQLYSAASSSTGDSLSLAGWVLLSGHPVLESIYDTWIKNEDYFPELSGEQLKSYYELLLAGLSVTVPDWQDGQKQYGHFLPSPVGCLYAWSEIPYNEAEIKILKRFGTIIDLTFRRYIELQKSEANAREAVRQASLDRVRAEIASMRTTIDLERITPLVWNELTILGVPFIRCGVFIMDELQRLIHTFLSTPEGKAIAAFHIPYTTPGNIAEVLSHWQQKENYIAHWDDADFMEFAGTLVKQAVLASPEQYLQTIPHGGFYLHFLPFLQGMLYVGNTTKLGEDEITLIQSVAASFATAYARYEDFNKLEAAKQTVEKTLVDLKQAQTQLVQAEKMASLGQLTAGIAHEIQNPLNFVNNFSEVSEELVKEMIDEVNKGNIDEVKAIAGDLVQNLGKIYHHGKRADSIVKGMLEHSRTSTGSMEPTDINALADEYLRLSYHGFRAKDKLFNTAIQTDFDNSIDKINIIGQDIGRVLLNLYNNAFYAVNERKKLNNDIYEPIVSISTKKTGGSILISVKDNGNGIPQKIIDKIFQPFFTTKPTGQGTGLGLSLSYDIVKAHGGELKIETKESEGAVFTIELPITTN